MWCRGHFGVYELAVSPQLRSWIHLSCKIHRADTWNKITIILLLFFFLVEFVCCLSLVCIKIYIMTCKFSVMTSSNTLQFSFTYWADVSILVLLPAWSLCMDLFVPHLLKRLLNITVIREDSAGAISAVQTDFCLAKWFGTAISEYKRLRRRKF